MTLKIDKSMSVPGVYKYTNINTGALYVGSAKDLYDRHIRHLNPLDIDVAIANEGIKNFTFEILEEFPKGINKDILLQNERKWINYYDAERNPLHYNRPREKYTMWDPFKVKYEKHPFDNNKGLDSRKCFRVKSLPNRGKVTQYLPIGMFNEFISPEIIYDLSQKWS